MKRNREAVEGLKTGKSRVMEVALIDDNADVIKKFIENKVFCYVYNYSFNCASEPLDHEMTRKSLLANDILFWDASLCDDAGISVIDTLEKLIQIEPRFADISRVVIGQDIIQYVQSSDLKTRILIERVKRLPHIIYGRERGTKIDNMLNHMRKVAVKNNIELPVRLPRGVCRKEIIDKVEPYLSLVSQNLQEQIELAISIFKDFKDFQPTNEEERDLLDVLSKMSDLLAYNQHYINNLYEVMFSSYYSSIEKQQDGPVLTKKITTDQETE